MKDNNYVTFFKHNNDTFCCFKAKGSFAETVFRLNGTQSIGINEVPIGREGIKKAIVIQIQGEKHTNQFVFESSDKIEAKETYNLILSEFKKC